MNLQIIYKILSHIGLLENKKREGSKGRDTLDNMEMESVQKSEGFQIPLR